MSDIKILLCGPMGAGKTTAIAAVSDIPPLCTDVHNTDRAQSSKAMTTVALDYGELRLQDGQVLKLFGAPGQERFGFLRRSLAVGALGVVVLLDNSRPDPLVDLADQLDGLEPLLREERVVVGVGRLEQHPSPSVLAHTALLRRLGYAIPVLKVDVRKPADVALLFETLLQQIETLEPSS